MKIRILGIAIGVISVIALIITFAIAPLFQTTLVALQVPDNFNSMENNSELTGELDIIAMSLTIPKDILQRSFPGLYEYSGTILQTNNMYSDIFDKSTLEKLLYNIDYWIDKPEDLDLDSAKDKYLSEQENINNITEDEIKDMTYKDFVERRDIFTKSEQVEFNPSISTRKFYDNKIIYILKSKYRKYIVTFGTENEKIISYKVVEIR